MIKTKPLTNINITETYDRRSNHFYDLRCISSLPTLRNLFQICSTYDNIFNQGITPPLSMAIVPRQRTLRGDRRQAL